MVDAAAAVCVAGVLLGSGLPSLHELTGRHALQGAAALLETQMQLARSTAVAQRQPVRLSFQSSPDASCWVLHTGSARHCSCLPPEGVRCSAPARALASELLPAEGRVQARANVAGMVFDADWGTVTPTGTVALHDRHGHELRVVVNLMGRARQCVVGRAWGGLPTC